MASVDKRTTMGVYRAIAGSCPPVTLETPERPKTFIFLVFVLKVFHIGHSSLQLRLDFPMLRHPGYTLGPLGAILGPPWSQIGALLGHLGATLVLVGASWGPPWDHLGSSWRYTVKACRTCCPSWAI